MFQPYELTAPELLELRRAESAAEPFLALRDGAGALRLHPLTKADRLTIGRMSDNDIVVSWDDSVSRVHILLERFAGAWTVADDGLSRHGSFINDERIAARRRLDDGDVLRIGRTRFLFRWPTAGGPVAEVSDTTAAADAASMARITPAQKRVLIALCRPFAGHRVGAAASNQEIADELTISLDAVRTHLKALYRELDVPGLAQNFKRMELARRALEAGIVSERDLRDDPAQST